MRRRVELALVVAVALAAVALPAAAADWPEVPEPEDAHGEWVSKHMIYNGLPMRASRFTTARSVQQVVDFYNQRWPGQTVVNVVAGKTVVGHAERNHYVTIEIQPQGGGSQGQVGIVELPKDKAAKVPGDDFPKPGGTRVVNDIQYVDDPGRTLAMESTLSPFQSESFYRSRLPGQGWTREASSAPCSMIANSCVARYSKGSQEMTMTFSRIEQGTSIVVNQTQH